MSKKLWQEELRRQLATLPQSKVRPKVCLLGVGHALRGDDAAGVILARLLKRQLQSAKVKVIEAGVAPENCCGPVLNWNPDLILIVDAADMGAVPGDVRWLAWSEVLADGGTTHHFSLSLLAGYLAAEAQCPVSLLGIQPADTRFCATLSPSVTASVARTVRALVHILPGDGRGTSV